MTLSLRTRRALLLITGVAMYGCYSGSALDDDNSGASNPSGGDAGLSSANTSRASAGSTVSASSATGSAVGNGSGSSAVRSSASDSSATSGSPSSDASSAGDASLPGSSSSSRGSSSGSSSTDGSSSSSLGSASSSSASSGAAADAAVYVYDTPVECSSGKMYTGGTGPTMEPGLNCAECHGGTLSIDGTVYKTGHEPDGCDGVNVTGLTVVITDSTNDKITLTPNSVGNFYYLPSINPPITATVTYNGKTTAMTTPQMVTDCNSCHTEEGANGAPGRIVLP